VVAIVSNKVWNKHFTDIWAANLFVSIAMVMLNNTLALYIDDLGGSTRLSGAMTSAFAIAALLTRVFSGDLVDVKGRRAVMIAGCLIFAIATLIFNVTTAFWVLLALRALQGVGFSAAGTAFGAAAADVLPKSRIGEGIGYYGLGMPLATAIGPSMGLALINHGDYRLMFFGTTLIIMVSCLLSFFCRYEKNGGCFESKVGEIKQHHHDKTKRIWDKIETSALKPSLVQLPVIMAFTCVTTFLTLYAAVRGFTTAGLFFAVAASTMALARVTAGQLTDRLGPLTVLIPGLVLGAASFLVLAFTSNQVLFVTCGGIYGLCSGITMPVLNTIVIKNAPRERIGAAQATYYLAWDMGNVVGGVVWGAILEYAGFIAMFCGATVCLMLSVAMSLLFFVKK
jgi:MFS family permease